MLRDSSVRLKQNFSDRHNIRFKIVWGNVSFAKTVWEAIRSIASLPSSHGRVVRMTTPLPVYRPLELSAGKWLSYTPQLPVSDTAPNRASPTCDYADRPMSRPVPVFSPVEIRNNVDTRWWERLHIFRQHQHGLRMPPQGPGERGYVFVSQWGQDEPNWEPTRSNFPAGSFLFLKERERPCVFHLCVSKAMA